MRRASVVFEAFYLFTQAAAKKPKNDHARTGKVQKKIYSQCLAEDERKKAEQTQTHDATLLYIRANGGAW